MEDDQEDSASQSISLVTSDIEPDEDVAEVGILNADANMVPVSVEMGITENPDVLGMDQEILKCLGEDHLVTASLDIHPVVQKRWSIILTSGLQHEERQQLLQRHAFPSNLPFLMPPQLNTEILSALPESAIKSDKFQMNRQSQLGKGISALGQALNLILQESIGSSPRSEIIKLLGESGKVLTDLHFRLSLSRRMSLMPHLNKLVKECSAKEPVSGFLFGENLSEKVKAAKAIQKSASDLRKGGTANISKRVPPNHKVQPLNYRGPSRFRETRRPQASSSHRRVKARTSL